MRTAAHYIHGLDGPVVSVPARVAAILNRQFRIDRWRIDVRGEDGELDQVLIALSTAATLWAEKATAGSGSPAATDPAVAVKLNVGGAVMDIAAAADRLDLTKRGVRDAACAGRLVGQKVSGCWVFAPNDVDDFAERRARH